MMTDTYLWGFFFPFPSSGNNGSPLPSAFWNLWPRNPILWRQARLLTGRVWPRALHFRICCTLVAGRQGDVSGCSGQTNVTVAVPEGLRAGKGGRQVLVAGWWQQADRPVHHFCFFREKQVLFPSPPCARVCPCDYETSAKSHYVPLFLSDMPWFLHRNLHSCKSDRYS